MRALKEARAGTRVVVVVGEDGRRCCDFGSGGRLWSLAGGLR